MITLILVFIGLFCRAFEVYFAPELDFLCFAAMAEIVFEALVVVFFVIIDSVRSIR